jgi:hypothetical protein
MPLAIKKAASSPTRQMPQWKVSVRYHASTAPSENEKTSTACRGIFCIPIQALIVDEETVFSYLSFAMLIKFEILIYSRNSVNKN